MSWSIAALVALIVALSGQADAAAVASPGALAPQVAIEATPAAGLVGQTLGEAYRASRVAGAAAKLRHLRAWHLESARTTVPAVFRAVRAQGGLLAAIESVPAAVMGPISAAQRVQRLPLVGPTLARMVPAATEVAMRGYTLATKVGDLVNRIPVKVLPPKVAVARGLLSSVQVAAKAALRRWNRAAILAWLKPIAKTNIATTILLYAPEIGTAIGDAAGRVYVYGPEHVEDAWRYARSLASRAVSRF